MPITPDEAAEVAAKHGLSLADAAGLVNLANDTDDADRIAGKFAATSTADDTTAKEFAARLFGRKDDTPPDEPPATPNVVPNEGGNARVPDDGRRVLRQYAADLFDTPDRDHI